MKPAKKPDKRNVPHQTRTAGKEKSLSLKPLIVGNIVIAVIAFIVFSPGLTAEFQGWDDYNYIKDNALIRVLSWENIMHVFNYKTIVVGNYHPLTILSYIFEYQLVGLNPFLYHFDNLLLHLFNTVLVSLLMWLLTKKTYATLIATALFAVHPMRVESVVWAAERKDVLYTFFFLLSLVFYIYFLLKSRRNYQYYFISIVFFILSILSKGQAVVLPLTLFLVDYWYSKKITLSSILNKLPYFAFSLMSGILALIAQQSSLTEQRLLVHSFAERLAIAGFNISAYLYKLVYPFNLSCFYKYPAVGDMLWIYAGALIAIAIIVITAVFFRKNKIVVFGSLFFLFTISIVTQLLPVGNAIIADRYTYIPYIGLFFIAGMLFDQFITGKRKNSQVLLFIPIAILVVFSIKSYAQSLTWHDNETLWQNAIKQDPDNGVAYNNLGHYYTQMEDYATAITMLKTAIRNEATYIEVFGAYQNLGVAYTKVGKNEEALENFSIAISKRPAFLEAYFSRGLTYTDLGRYNEAIADFTTVISKLNPLHAKSYYSRGVAFNKINMADSAIADYTSAIRIDPNYSEAYVNRGNIYFAHNSFDAAIADYNAAIGINPEAGNVFLNRSFVYFKMQRYKNALEDALKAKDLKTDVHPNYIRDLQNANKSF
ncbi:MAG: tetratricopeptide repeat protein [Bacteroidetes bacterium]|nr:tetratricopeptide repeat protein [Bacteroidota bacterium]